MADGLQQVGFPQTNTSVDDQRVELGFAWRPRHRLGGGVGKAVSLADDERIETVAFVQRGKKQAV